MEFKQLSYIVKVAECRNITKAAKELFVSQPSLSQFVAKTEEDLGMKLFDRSTSPLSLTYAGEKYVEAAKEILKISKNLNRELADIADYRKGRLSAGIPRERVGYMLPPILREFRRRYPGIEVKTTEMSADFLMEELKRGKIDIALIPERPLTPELEAREIYEEELLLVTGEEIEPRCICSDSSCGIVDWEKVKDLPFVVLKRSYGSRRKCEEVFKAHGIKPEIVFETSSNSTALQLAASGVAAAVVPEMTVKLFRGAKRFYSYSLGETPVTWKVFAVYRKDTYQNRAQREFIQIAQEIFGSKTED